MPAAMLAEPKQKWHNAWIVQTCPNSVPPKISKQLWSLEHLYPSSGFSTNGYFMEDLQADVQILGQSLLLLLLFPWCLKPFGIHRIAWMVNSAMGYIQIFCLKALFLEEIQAHVAVAILSPSSSSSPSLLRFFFHRSDHPKCCSTSIYCFYPFSVFIISTTMKCYYWCARKDRQHNMHSVI